MFSTGEPIWELARTKGIFIDVGAFSGAYSVANLGAKLVIAFEPDPRTFERLKSSLSRFPNVRLYQKAILDYKGKITLHVRPRAGWTSSVVHNTEDSEDITVECDVLDSCIGDFLEFGSRAEIFLKVDTEGANHMVLRGAKTLLTNYKPRLAIEYHDNSSLVLDEISKYAYSVVRQVTDVHDRAWKEHGWIVAE